MFSTRWELREASERDGGRERSESESKCESECNVIPKSTST